MRRLASASAHHKHLQPVLDIGEAHIGVVIERQNIRMRVAFLELFDDAAPHDVVGKAAKRLQDDERIAAMLRLMQNLGGDEHAFPGVEGVMDDWVARLHEIAHAAWRLIERVRFANAVAHIMRMLEKRVCHAIEGNVRSGPGHMEFTRLGILVEIRFANHVGHARLDNLEAVPFKIRFNVAIGARMEVEQVFAHDEHRRARVASVVLHVVHKRNRMFEPTLRASNAMTLDAFHNRVDARPECRISSARLKLIGANTAQERLERVNHGQAHGDANRAREIHAKAWMDIMRVSIVVRDNGNMLIPRIVERFAQQRRIVGKAAIADVFSRANSDISIVVLTAFERGERFTYYDLGREAYVVVHVSLAQLDSTFAAQIERNGAHALLAKHRAHEPAERVRCSAPE